jgi:hypothetical protein
MEGIKHMNEILIQHFVLLNSKVITHYRTMKKTKLLKLMRRQADNMDPKNCLLLSSS